MLRNILALGGILFILSSLNAQSNPVSDPVIYAGHITEENLKADLTVLTSDSLEGREAGTIGNDRAARFIASKFREFGLTPIADNNGYLQSVYLTSAKWDVVNIKVNNIEYRNLFDFVVFPALNEDIEFSTKEIIYLGYGIDDPAYSDYKGVDVRGKSIVIYEGEPLKKDSTSLLTGIRMSSIWSANDELKLKTALAKGVKYVFIVKQDVQKFFERNRQSILGNQMKPCQGLSTPLLANHAYISQDMLKGMAGKQYRKFLSARKKSLKKGKALSFSFFGNFTLKQKKAIKELRSNNILGYLPGKDPQVSDQVLVITAHMDHLGKRGENIYYGADDDGSGTSAVIELARTFKLAADRGFGPRRSILFMLVTGEEKGLLGSDYYTTYPIIPLANTVVDLNIDMIGRVDKKYELNPNYIYVIGSDKLSTELHNLSESVNSKYSNLILDYTYNDEKDPNRYYYRSDHYNFAKNNIPVIFYFNGTHADYHKPSDTIDKINFEILRKRAQLVFFTAWEIANRDQRIIVDKKEKE